MKLRSNGKLIFIICAKMLLFRGLSKDLIVLLYIETIERGAGAVEGGEKPKKSKERKRDSLARTTEKGRGREEALILCKFSFRYNFVYPLV